MVLFFLVPLLTGDNGVFYPSTDVVFTPVVVSDRHWESDADTFKGWEESQFGLSLFG